MKTNRIERMLRELREFNPTAGVALTLGLAAIVLIAIFS